MAIFATSLLAAAVQANAGVGSPASSVSCLKILKLSPGLTYVPRRPTPWCWHSPADPARDFTPASAAVAHPDSQAFGGYPSVGKLFFESVIGQKSCTAEAINSPDPPKAGSGLILTAAHCVVGVVAGEPYGDKDFVFAPKWANGKSPYGRWKITLHNVYVDDRWSRPTPRI